MKKLLFIITTLFILSCSKDDPTCDIYFHNEQKTDIWKRLPDGSQVLQTEGDWIIKTGTTPYLYSHKCEEDGQIQGEGFQWNCYGCATSQKVYTRTILRKH